jgi:hypothetical protein
MEEIGKSDPLFAYVNNWRVGYSRQAGGSLNLYYVLTGTALVATSLVTAVSALGGVFPGQSAALLIVTTALGLIATVAAGLDRMLNDRKDFMRSGRYSTLLEIETVKFMNAYVQAKTENGKAILDTDLRKAFVDAVCKIRADELSDWIQDETSATVELVGLSAGVTAAQELGRKERDAFDADKAARSAAAASDAANADFEKKSHDRDAIQASYDAALASDPSSEKPETVASAKALENAKKLADDARIAADAKKADAQRLSAIADQKHADLTAAPQPPQQPQAQGTQQDVPPATTGSRP